jgi:hypothetical protein
MLTPFGPRGVGTSEQTHDRIDGGSPGETRMFTGTEFSKLVDEEALKIRQADRETARLEFDE